MVSNTRRRFLQTLAGGALISGGIGSVRAHYTQQTSELKTTKFVCQAKTHDFPPGVSPCEDQTQSNDYSLIGGGVSWPGEEVGYHVVEDSAQSAGISQSDFQDAGDGAAAAWDQFADRISLTKGGTDIEIEFGSIDGPVQLPGPRGNAIGIVRLTWNNTTGNIVNVNLILDTAERWQIYSPACPTPNDRDAFDVQNILMHELGHALGLGHESDEDTDMVLTMYPTVTTGETIKRSPEEGDIGGIEALYG